jgi:hypothetical protein
MSKEEFKHCGQAFPLRLVSRVLSLVCFVSNDAGMFPGTYTQKNKEKNKTTAYAQG